MLNHPFVGIGGAAAQAPKPRSYPVVLAFHPYGQDPVDDDREMQASTPDYVREGQRIDAQELNLVHWRVPFQMYQVVDEAKS